MLNYLLLNNGVIVPKLFVVGNSLKFKAVFAFRLFAVVFAFFKRPSVGEKCFVGHGESPAFLHLCENGLEEQWYGHSVGDAEIIQQAISIAIAIILFQAV